jgi:hypothetical protein
MSWSCQMAASSFPIRSVCGIAKNRRFSLPSIGHDS